MSNISPQPRALKYFPKHRMRQQNEPSTSLAVPVETSSLTKLSSTIISSSTTTSLSSSTSFVSSTPTTSLSSSTNIVIPSLTTSSSSANTTGSSSLNSLSITTTDPSTLSSPSSLPSSTALTSSSASSTGKPQTVDDQRLGSGAVAGIGIGTFFGGVLLTLAGVCLFAMLRKKKRRSHDSVGQRRPYQDSDLSQDNGTPMKQVASAVQPWDAGDNMKLNRILLEPTSNSDIKTDMLTIGSQIIQHVDNNYHLKHIDSLPASFTENMARGRYNTLTGVSIEQVGQLLCNVQTRRATIRHLISYFIFSSIALTSDIETSLLPGHIIAFFKQMPSPERSSGSREAYYHALTKWRLLSAYLLQTVRSNRDPLLPRDSDTQPAIKRNVTTIRQILQPFVVTGADRRQAENLQALMAEGSRFGLLLFQQPISWVVDWGVLDAKLADTKIGGSGRAKAASIVLFPGLVQIADREGNRFVKVRTVLVAEVLQL